MSSMCSELLPAGCNPVDGGQPCLLRSLSNTRSSTPYLQKICNPKQLCQQSTKRIRSSTHPQPQYTEPVMIPKQLHQQSTLRELVWSVLPKQSMLPPPPPPEQTHQQRVAPPTQISATNQKVPVPPFMEAVSSQNNLPAMEAGSFHVL
jgi:hypothetical protein